MIGGKEILWEEIKTPLFADMMRQIYSHTQTVTRGISFGCNALRINVQYDNPDFKELLEEKFDLSEPYLGVPCLTFVRYKNVFGFKLPYEQYGYVSEDRRSALVFASSFGVFKSVISGYTSLCLEHLGHIPVHGSVFSVNRKGVVLTGGTLAGKTTTLLKLVSMAMRDGQEVKILTDDWAVISEGSCYYTARTFDHSVSLRERDLVENPDIRFCRHNDLVEIIRRRSKISMKPEDLYGLPVGADRIKLDVVILLKPLPGTADLRPIDAAEFADEVIDAAYHYPYISQSQIKAHKDFWMKAVARLKVFAFATRPMAGKLQDVDKIRRLLM